MNYEEEIISLKNRISLLENIILANTKPAKTEEVSTNKLLRDKTKYLYNNKILPKNRLVLNVIKDYVIKNNPTFEQLKNIFDKSLQGTRNVVEDILVAKKISDCSKRYFMNESEILNLCDGQKVVVCTQWGSFNIHKFLKVAINLDFNIQIIN